MMGEEKQNIFDINREFFVIDSECLDEVETRLYGFIIANNMLVEQTTLLDNIEVGGDGAFVYVQRSVEKIIIKQDFIGSYGLYLYKNKDYFALSNSFVVLVDYVKKVHPISFNRDYANFLITSSLCSVAYSETMINEIELLDRSSVIEIDVQKKLLEIKYIDYEENSVELNTEKGMKILDSWYFKWTSLIQNLNAKNSNIQIDLSGGFDSRITLALVLGSGIDLNNVYVNSIDDKLHTHAEDFEIASLISEHYNFVLNNRNGIVDKAVNHTIEDALNISFYLKLCFHKQMYLKLNHRVPSRHYFGGSGGECIRSYWNMSEQEYVEDMLKRCRPFSTSIAKRFEKSTRIILNSAFDKINQKHERFGRKVDPADMTLNLYRETRCRNHFGKDVLENYYGGAVKYCPLLDQELHKLKLNDAKCADKNLLMAVIFDRYNPDLLKFKFEGKRSIDSSTIEYAKQINKRFPFMFNSVECKIDIGSVQVNQKDIYRRSKSENPRITNEVVAGLIKDAFYSNKVKNSFELVYEKEIYDYIVRDISTKKYHPLENAYVAIGISKIIQDVCANENLRCGTISSYISNQLLYGESTKRDRKTLREHAYLDYYITARVDVKNVGSDSNNLEVVDVSDENARITSPKWFDKNGQGYIAESKQGTLDLVFKCINSGNLTIALRGRDVRNKDGVKIPFWIDYHMLKINDRIVFDEVKPVWHDFPFKFNCAVKDGDIIKLSLVWNPHDETCCRAQHEEVQYSDNLIYREERLLRTKDEISKTRKRSLWNAVHLSKEIPQWCNYYKTNGFTCTLDQIHANYFRGDSERKGMEYGVTRVKRDEQLIVSLTSFPARIKTVHKGIISLLKQSIKPDKLILWLAESQFPAKENELPKELLELKKYGLEIMWCDDIRSYKKLIPAIEKYPDAVIVTADDDNIYDFTWLELLYEAYQKSPSEIHCHRVTKFYFDLTKLEFNIIAGGKEYYSQPNFMNKLVGVGGVLYPPHCFHNDILKRELFMKLAPSSDDIWFWLMAALNDVRVNVVPNHILKANYIPGTQEGPSLTHINHHGEKLFWVHFHNMLQYYPELVEKLKQDGDLPIENAR